MVGTSVIGDNKLSAESLPPEARMLNRTFRLLHDPAVIHRAVLDVLARAPPCHQIPQIRQLFKVSFRRLKEFERRQDRMFEQKLAKAVNAAIESAFSGYDENDSDSLTGSPVRKIPAAATSDDDASIREVEAAVIRHDRSPPPRNTGPSRTAPPASATKDQASIALVSEAEQVATMNTEDSASFEAPRNVKDFWGMLLEAMQLEVASRTTRVWGRKKIYEIYRLNGPATSTKSPLDIRRAIHAEFSSIYGGVKFRSYALQRESDGYFCILLKVGKYYDYQDERNRSTSGEKKKKQGNEYVIMVKPGSSLMAVTASRAPSRATHFKYLSPALDLSLATVDKNLSRSVAYEPPTRVGDYKGTEPMDLLHSAQAAETGSATGRFATFASNDTNQDPLTEMDQVATGSVVNRTGEKTRLATSAVHGRDVAQAAARAPEGTAMTLVAEGIGAVLDHAAADKQDRKRARGEHFGEGGPQLKKVRFKWSGTTMAARDSWACDSNRGTKLKCVVTFSGADVFEGFREMLALGLINSSMPDYMKDAPHLGTSTITVRDGAIVMAEETM